MAVKQGFIPLKTDDGKVHPFEYLPCSAMQPKLGMLMTQSSGNLVAAGATAAPTYICMCEKSAAVAAGTLIPVIRVDKETIYETTNSTALSTGKAGAKVTTSDGLKVTATTSSGVAEIVWYDEAAAAGAGGVVHVRF